MRVLRSWMFACFCIVFVVNLTVCIYPMWDVCCDSVFFPLLCLCVRKLCELEEIRRQRGTVRAPERDTSRGRGKDCAAAVVVLVPLVLFLLKVLSLVGRQATVVPPVTMQRVIRVIVLQKSQLVRVATTVEHGSFVLSTCWSHTAGHHCGGDGAATSTEPKAANSQGSLSGCSPLSPSVCRSVEGGSNRPT